MTIISSWKLGQIINEKFKFISMWYFSQVRRQGIFYKIYFESNVKKNKFIYENKQNFFS